MASFSRSNKQMPKLYTCRFVFSSGVPGRRSASKLTKWTVKVGKLPRLNNSAFTPSLAKFLFPPRIECYFTCRFLLHQLTRTSMGRRMRRGLSLRLEGFSWDLKLILETRNSNETWNPFLIIETNFGNWNPFLKYKITFFGQEE